MYTTRVWVEGRYSRVLTHLAGNQGNVTTAVYGKITCGIYTPRDSRSKLTTRCLMHSSTSVGTMASDHSGSSAMILRMLRVSAAGLSLSLSVGDGTCAETSDIQQDDRHSHSCQISVDSQQTAYSCKTSNAFGDRLLSDLTMNATSYSRQTSRSTHILYSYIHTLCYK